jgi:hypothetical protein
LHSFSLFCSYPILHFRAAMSLSINVRMAEKKIARLQEHDGK